MVASCRPSAALAFLLLGCGATAVAPADGGTPFVTCETDPRALPYQEGLSVPSLGDIFTATLLSSTPGPPVKGRNRWLVQIQETATGTLLDGLDVAVAPFMPDHGHDTLKVNVTPAGAGTYDFEPVYLYMSGLWEVRIDIRGAGPGNGGGISDRAIIPSCIP